MFVEGLVSTIIPVHNRPTLLREAVASVLAQSYRPIEIFIVNDGSKDETGPIAEALAEAYPEVRAIHRENGGPGAARETGRLAARGEFIQYLDSDDLLLPTKFELQVSGLRRCGDCTVSYGKTRFYAYGDRPTDQPWKRTGERIPTMFPSFLRSRRWGTSTPLYRREVTDRAGPWMRLKNEEDWEYDCRIAAIGVRLHCCEAFVSDERAHSGHRLSMGGSSEPEKLRNRAAAHKLIFTHAEAAKISPQSVEMQHFARELFLLGRQTGAVGLSEESQMLFELARWASGTDRSRGIDFLLYAAGARLVGWRAMGRLACSLGEPTASFVGFLNQSEISRAYVAADCLVLPSDAGETWGLVVNEAMASGLPCVVSNGCGCVEDLIAPIRPDLCYPLGDITALERAMAAAISDAPPPQLLRARVSEYDVSKTIDTIESLYWARASRAG